jgi:hypothetical protein
MIAGSSSAIGVSGSGAAGSWLQSSSNCASISSTGAPGDTPPSRSSRFRSAIKSFG